MAAASINAGTAGGGGASSGIGEAPSNRTTTAATTRHRQASSIDKFMRALLPQSAFPSSIAGHQQQQDPSHLDHHTSFSEVGGIQAGNVDVTNNTLSRTSSISSTSSSHQHSTSPPTAGVTPGKSKNRVPRSSIGAGKAAHAHRHNLSIDSSTLLSSNNRTTTSPNNNMITRTRSKTGTVAPNTAPSGVRSASPASFYAGGIGGYILHFCI